MRACPERSGRVQTRYRQAAEEFARRLVEALPEVEAIVLYGSVARGEAHQDSDIDVLVLTEGESKALQERAWAIGQEIDDELHVFTQVAMENVSDFRARAEMGYPWERTIARMGQPLFDRGAFASIHAALPRVREEQAPYRPSQQVIEDLLQSADQALAEAKHLLEGRFWDGASSRAYYAMFYAASAAVMWAGVEEIRSHKALIDLFGRHVVQARGVEPAYLKELQAAFQLRLNADYKPGFHIDRTTATQTSPAAERFVARLRELLAGGREPP